MNIQHSSRTDQWGTPPHILAAVREVMGSIDLDPASSKRWNESVQATRFLTEGLESWESTSPQNIYLNPPGGKLGNKSLACLFWQRLMKERDAGLVKQAVFVAFSAEALQNTQGKNCKPIMDFTFCVPSKRLRFVSEDGKKNAPSHSNVIVYVPGTEDNSAKFFEVFSKIGAVR